MTTMTVQTVLALATALVGVLLYGFAPRLPSALPAAFTRLVGVFVLFEAAGTLYFLLDALALTFGVAFGGLAIMIVIHIIQIKAERKTAPAGQDALPTPPAMP